MTKNIYRLTEWLTPQVREKHIPPVVRDAWATIMRWRGVGEPIHRLRPAELDLARAGLPPELSLPTAPIRDTALLYELTDRGQWIIVARHRGGQQYACSPELFRAYSTPTLTYCTLLPDGALGSGAINLEDQSTPSRLRISPGTSMGEWGPREIDPEEIRLEMIRLAMVLPHFYRYGKA